MIPKKVCLFVSVIVGTGLANAKGNFWVKRVPLIENKLSEAIGLYEAKDARAAKKACDDAYFELFEGTGANMEVAIRGYISAQAAADLEDKFGKIRNNLSKGKD